MDEQLIRIFISQGDSGLSLNWWNLLFLASLWFMSVVTSPFLMLRAKNLATKKDIAGITSEIESVKLEFDLLKEKHQQRNRLSLAAIDTRLRIHQEAYIRWHEVFRASHEGGDQLIEKVRLAEDWLVNNCLYLDDEVRKSMRLAMVAAPLRKSALRDGDVKVKKENWNQMVEAGLALMDATGLPGFSEEELVQMIATEQDGE